jgi:hypothetical protein
MSHWLPALASLPIEILFILIIFVKMTHFLKFKNKINLQLQYHSQRNINRNETRELFLPFRPEMF